MEQEPTIYQWNKNQPFINGTRTNHLSMEQEPTIYQWNKYQPFINGTRTNHLSMEQEPTIYQWNKNQPFINGTRTDHISMEQEPTIYQSKLISGKSYTFKLCFNTKIYIKVKLFWEPFTTPNVHTSLLKHEPLKPLYHVIKHTRYCPNPCSIISLKPFPNQPSSLKFTKYSEEICIGLRSCTPHHTAGQSTCQACGQSRTPGSSHEYSQNPTAPF